MGDLRDLYQEMILDHSKSPRNFHSLPAARRVEGFNPLCGDRVTLYLSVENDMVKDAAFEGSGCAIATASASMMTEKVKGKTVGEALALFDRFHELLTGAPKASANGSDLGKLEVFSGVREFPIRVKCATLAWHALKAALAGEGDRVSTE
ncbi:MAG TPA: SUF system NifU family Fe-S cluster assembly protein [Candidatus Polarisedimenticolia bacterium]|nr:SUF system NifU family Fe-S cluster assembly protein [Candidatus Polarisedimenticolia bacterium]